MVEVDSSKCLYKIGATEGKLNSRYAQNQFNTCTEEIVNIAHVLLNEISLRDTSLHYLVGKDTSAAAVKHLARVNHVLAEKLRRSVTQNATTADCGQINKA